jgi:hypothetical protein
METYIKGWRVVSDSGCVLLYRPGNTGHMHDHCILAPEGKKYSVSTACAVAEEYISSQTVATANN